MSLARDLDLVVGKRGDGLEENQSWKENGDQNKNASVEWETKGLRETEGCKENRGLKGKQAIEKENKRLTEISKGFERKIGDSRKEHCEVKIDVKGVEGKIIDGK